MIAQNLLVIIRENYKILLLKITENMLLKIHIKIINSVRWVKSENNYISFPINSNNKIVIKNIYGIKIPKLTIKIKYKTISTKKTVSSLIQN